jgi:serine/threonine-protein kinase
MAIGKGDRIGPYLVLTPIGVGGTATVYRARDTRVGRDVAIKVLPAPVDANQRARTDREARILGTLNHPNIAQLHTIDEFDGERILVLELVDGVTLEDRLTEGRMSLEEALGVATQIVDALDAAHERAIVHRDLKPGNIVVRPDGMVKVLDFGLAKELVPIPETALSTLTADGLVMGTTPYMSPEQARGAPIDQRTDIWAFGCVLYEMIAGRRAFEGATRSDVLAAIIERSPDWNLLPAETPAPLRRVLQRCLQKDPRDRLRHIGDARFELRESLQPESTDVDAGNTPRRHFFAIASAAAIVLIGSIWFVARRSSSEPSAVTRSAIGPIEAPAVQPFGIRHIAISGDGTHLAYVSGKQLFVRSMARTQAMAVSSPSPSISVVGNPFFSTDGKWLAFNSFYDLQKVSIDGGEMVRVTSFKGRNFGGTWGRDGTIVFATEAGLFRVSEQGGEPQLLKAPERDDLLLVWPEFMPDGRSLLFTRLPAGSVEAAEIVLFDLKTSKSTVVVRGGAGAHYVPDGYLVYGTSRGLQAIAFDPDTGKASTDAVPIPDSDIAIAADNGAADFAVSSNGTLVLFPPPVLRPFQLVWIDRTGRQEVIRAIPPAAYGYPRLSPEGKRIAVDIVGSNRDVYVFDLEHGTRIRLSEGPNEDLIPVWSADGRRVYYGSNRGGFHVYSRAADGTGPEELLIDNADVQLPLWLGPGNRLLFFKGPYETSDLGSVSLDRPTTVEWLFRSKYSERNPAVSHDGHWIAYDSDESGRNDIWVRPYPDVGKARFPIGPGLHARWSPQGDQLYYRNADLGMMAADVKVSTGFHAGAPHLLFPNDRFVMLGAVEYDVAPDGRFLMTQMVGAAGSSPVMISVALNWLSELKALLPH